MVERTDDEATNGEAPTGEGTAGEVTAGEVTAGPRAHTSSYAAVLGVYGLVALAAGTRIARSSPTSFRAPVPWSELLRAGLATHKLSRLLSKSTVATPIRAPFTEYVGHAGPAETMERARGRGVRHSIGQLLSCPFCLDVWVAGGMVATRELAPRLHHAAVSVLDLVALADALQHAYARLES